MTESITEFHEGESDGDDVTTDDAASLFWLWDSYP